MKSATLLLKVFTFWNVLLFVSEVHIVNVTNATFI